MNKLSLVGMQLPEKYKENFDVLSKGPSSGVSRLSKGEFQRFERRPFVRNARNVEIILIFFRWLDKLYFAISRTICARLGFNR
jgi:hypothetical protein